MTKTYVVLLEDGTKISATVSDEPWRSDVNMIDQEAVTEGLLLRAAHRKYGRPAPTVETKHLLSRELSMKDLPALWAFSLPAKENRYLGGDWEGPRDEAFLRCYIETQYVFLDHDFWVLFRRSQELYETRFLGLIGSPPEEPPELDYVLQPEARGQDYVAEAGFVALRYAETGLGLTATRICVVLENQADCAVATEIGERRDCAGDALQYRLFVKRENSVYEG